MSATLSAAGDLRFNVIRGAAPVVGIDVPWPDATSRQAIIAHGMPHRGLDAEVNWWRARNQGNLKRGWRRIAAAKALGVPTYYGALYCVVERDGKKIPLGLASLRVVTTAGVGYIVDAFQNTVELENMKYHGYGTGTTAEASGDTALVTELTTEYATNSTRPTGTTTEGASANIYRTVATLAPDSGGTLAITEHGIFSQAATGGGVLLDRTKFTAINLDTTAGDTLQTTYDLTLPAGS